MNARDVKDAADVAAATAIADADADSEETAAMDGGALLKPLMQARHVQAENLPSPAGVQIGELVAMTDQGRTPLVLYEGQPGSAAIKARATVDLHGAHIGNQVVLMFESGDPARPIVMGVLREGDGWPLDEIPQQVEIDADGERMIISAREQLVLRCGKASITLTKAGKVLIEGSYVLSRSAGVNRIKGGSVQLN